MRGDGNILANSMPIMQKFFLTQGVMRFFKLLFGNAVQSV